MAARIQTQSLSDIAYRVLSGLGQKLASIAEIIGSASDANHRLRIVERLNAKSDAELAALGIRREDIVRRVFIDRLDI
jgi:DNA-binding CsgD family transcriptional regulator